MSYTWISIVSSLKNNVGSISFSRELLNNACVSFLFSFKKNAGWFGTTADEMGCGSFRGIGKFIILFKSSS